MGGVGLLLGGKSRRLACLYGGYRWNGYFHDFVGMGSQFRDREVRGGGEEHLNRRWKALEEELL